MLTWKMIASGKRYDYYNTFDPSSRRYIYNCADKGKRPNTKEAGYFLLDSIVKMKNDTLVETFFKG